MNEKPLPHHVTFARLPQPHGSDALLEIRRVLHASPRKLVVLDDDPTGTQTVDDIPVVTRWDRTTLEKEFASPEPGFFILTNSRAMTEAESIALHDELLANLRAAAGRCPFTIVSRSDSTLRGHYKAETEAIDRAFGPVDIKVVAPYFEAGGRYTVGDVHYVVQDDQLVPAHLTPFAEDKVFGYRHSRLQDWVEEKSEGGIKSSEVVSISIETIRKGGQDAVTTILKSIPKGATCIVNACSQTDIEVFAAAALRLEELGCKLLYRTAASFVAARLGIRPAPPLPGEFISNRSPNGGLIVVGSYVPKTTEQLAYLRELEALEEVEFDVSVFLESGDPVSYVEQLIERIQSAIAAGRDALLFTSRTLVFAASSKENLEIGDRVAKALVAIVRGLKEPPGFVIAKGGITSSTLATDALDIRRAIVLGQLVPGVPVWRADGSCRFPEIDLVVFPGNVGNADSLAVAYQKISRLRSTSTHASTFQSQ